MKTFVKVLIGFSLLAAVLVAVVFYMTSGMSDSADKFFEAASAKRYEQAYQYVSRDFRKATSSNELTAFLSSSGLSGFESASWNKRSFSGNRGTLVGTVNTRSGGTIPVNLGLVKSESQWLVDSIFRPQAGIRASVDGSVPGRSAQVALVRATIRDFASAVEKSDFSEFHRAISPLLQEQISEKELQKTFKSFVDGPWNLTALNDISPIFDKQAFTDSNGILHLIGHYQTHPDQVGFNLKYIYRGTQWKLFGIAVNIPPVDHK